MDILDRGGFADLCWSTLGQVIEERCISHSCFNLVTKQGAAQDSHIDTEGPVWEEAFWFLQFWLLEVLPASVAVSCGRAAYRKECQRQFCVLGFYMYWDRLLWFGECNYVFLRKWYKCVYDGPL